MPKGLSDLGALELVESSWYSYFFISIRMLCDTLCGMVQDNGQVELTWLHG